MEINMKMEEPVQTFNSHRQTLTPYDPFEKHAQHVEVPIKCSRIGGGVAARKHYHSLAMLPWALSIIFLLQNTYPTAVDPVTLYQYYQND